MLPGARFAAWLFSLFNTPDAEGKSWSDKLAGWIINWISDGFVNILETLEPEAIELIEPILAPVRDHPATPDYLKAFINRILAGTQPLPLFVLIPIGVLLLIPTITSIFQPLGNLLRYFQERLFRSARMDPLSVITAWRRFPGQYDELFNDLRDLGWSEERIEALKNVTLYYPAPADLVRWQAREVFEPEMISKYGLDDELGGIQREPFYRAGMTDEQITNYWRAHWEHASFNQVVEMLRRGYLQEADLWDWFRLVEIPPYWRDRLIGISWEVPTRVDVRRFWDMRTIDESRLRSIYTAMGYHDQDLEDYVLWTKIYVDFPDLMTRYKNGWLTLDQVRTELIGLGMSTERAEELIQTKVKAVASETLVKERDLTLSMITRGVKKDVISREEATELIQELGYDPYETAVILAIEAPVDEVVSEVRIRELTKSDVLKGLATGELDENEALAKLIELRYTAADADLILRIYNASVKPPAEEKRRQESKADITKAVKDGLITAEDGYLRLLDIGFSPEAAEFILMVRAETSPFSPQSYNEFKSLTDLWKQAVGRGGPEMPEEIKELADELVRIHDEIESITRAIEEEKRNRIDVEVLPEEADEEIRRLQVALHRAEAEFSRVQTEYNIKRASLKYGE